MSTKHENDPQPVSLRCPRQVCLRLIETFVDKSEDTAAIAQQYVPAMMDPILGDYSRNVPDARWGDRWSVAEAVKESSLVNWLSRRCFWHSCAVAFCGVPIASQTDARRPVRASREVKI